MLLNVLLLEDDPNKKDRLLQFLNTRKGELFGNVDTALCVGDALKALQTTNYDLLMVDVIIPASLGGVAHEKNSIDFFEQLDEGVNVRRPRYAIALSASNELSAEARDFFVGRPWGILPYNNSDDECLTSIEKISKYILEIRRKGSPAKRCDAFILTALSEPEFSAIESRGFDWSPLEPLDETQFVRFGKINTANGEKIIGAAFAPRMGPVASSILASKAILQLHPKLLILGGICAGIESKASIGDVIAADISWDWQSGKYVDMDGKEHFEIAPDQISVDEQTRSQLTLLKRDVNFWTNLGIVSAKHLQKTPKLVIGPMATGSSVLADTRISDRIKATQHRNLTGLDMETYGVYAAARSCSKEIRYLSLKSVCDKGDIKKNDDFQIYASEISALTIEHFLKNYADTLLN